MTWSEMMAMPDYSEPTGLENTDLEIDETNTSSRQTTPTPNQRQSSPYKHETSSTTVHNINVNYRHTYSIERKNGDDVDLPALLQSLAHHTSIQSPSPSLKRSNSTINDSDLSSEIKKRKLVMPNLAQPLVFTTLDISDPPYLKYSDNMEGLIHDWEDSSYITIQGVPIPLKYWSQVFRWAKPKAWDVLKDNWSNWKVHSFYSIITKHSTLPLLLSYCLLNVLTNSFDLVICWCCQLLS